MTVEAKSMEIKKTKNASQVKEKTDQMHRAMHFVGDVKAEFKKITWTPKDELWAYTKIVVVATVALGFGIYLVDLGLQAVLHGLSWIVQFLGG